MSFIPSPCRTVSAAGALMIALAGTQAHASDKDQQAAVTTMVTKAGGSVALSYNHALDGEISDSGPRLRINAGYGSSETPGGARNERTSADLMLGYQFAQANWRVRVHAGVSYIDRTLLTAGRSNGFGLKVNFDLQSSRSKNYYADFASSYATRDNSYRFAVQTGVRVGTVFVGPEAAILGSDYFTSKRVGGVISGIRVDRLRISVRGGYTFGDEEGGGRNTPYGGIGLSLQF